MRCAHLSEAVEPSMHVGRCTSSRLIWLCVSGLSFQKRNTLSATLVQGSSDGVSADRSCIMSQALVLSVTLICESEHGDLYGEYRASLKATWGPSEAAHLTSCMDVDMWRERLPSSSRPFRERYIYKETLRSGPLRFSAQTGGSSVGDCPQGYTVLPSK